MTKMVCSAKWIDLVSFWDPFSVPFFSFFPFLLYRIFVAVWGSAFCFFLVHFWGPIRVQNAAHYFRPICSFSLPTQFAPRGRLRGYLSEFQGRFWGQISPISWFLFILWFILDVSFASPEHDCLVPFVGRRRRKYYRMLQFGGCTLLCVTAQKKTQSSNSGRCNICALNFSV